MQLGECHIYVFHSFICTSLIHSVICSFIYSLIHSFIQYIRMYLMYAVANLRPTSLHCKIEFTLLCCFVRLKLWCTLFSPTPESL